MQGFVNKLNRIFAKRSVMIVLSVIIAIVAWLAVMESSNPISERIVTVNIQYINAEKPIEKGFTPALEPSNATVEITISGRTTLINNVLPSDLSVVVDLSKVNEEGTVNIPIESPKCEKLGITIKDYYPKQISVNYAKTAEN